MNFYKVMLEIQTVKEKDSDFSGVLQEIANLLVHLSYIEPVSIDNGPVLTNTSYTGLHSKNVKCVINPYTWSCVITELTWLICKRLAHVILRLVLSVFCC